MSTLALLKKPANPEPEVDQGEETQTAVPSVSAIMSMTASKLNAAYEGQEETIDDWDDLSVPAKKTALIGLFHPDEGAGAPEKEAPPPTKAEIAAAKKAAPKTTAKKAAAPEIVKGDAIVDMAFEIESINSRDVALKRAKALMEEGDLSEFKLGGYLTWFYTKNDFGEHENFKGFVVAEFGFEYRKARYLMAIYSGLVEAKVPWEKVKDLGWSKLKEIVQFLTEETVDEWVERAEPMTVAQLKAYIAQMKSGEEGGGGDAPVSDTVSMSFKLHADQKTVVEAAIEKAMKMAGTDVKSVALEHIAQDFLAGPSKPGKTKKHPLDGKSTVEIMEAMFANAIEEAGDGGKAAAVETILTKFGEMFEDTVDLEVKFKEE